MLLWFLTLQDAKGLVDFRNVALALAALDGGRSLEELIHLAFEVPLRDCGDSCHPLPHSSSQEGGILRSSHCLPLPLGGRKGDQVFFFWEIT